MTNQPTEIAIVGGGMVGGALALGLAQHGFAVTVIEHAEPAPFVADSQPDVRISAISAASVSLLKGLGVWDAVQAMRCHPYRRLETWEWETAHVVFDAAELKLPLLGYMVENTVLQQALWQALEAHPKVTLRVPGSLIALHRHNDLQELELKGGETILAKLVIGADGANSQVLETIRSVIETAGGSMADVTFNSIFITDWTNYAAINEVYAEFFPGDKPARFCIQCGLVKPDALVGIASVAHIGTPT